MVSVGSQESLTTARKSLLVNLDPAIYGSFAEIGAGQEIARHFFKAPHSSGTIAKSMSAYDMKFSDAIYGRAQRYVCSERLQQMLDHEFELLEQRLASSRGTDSRFFACANTVATSSGDHEAQGWIGVRMQRSPGAEPDDVVCHVRMLDENADHQAAALGIVGVNMVYAASFLADDFEAALDSLLDNVGRRRIEVDFVSLAGPSFEAVDQRRVALHLVRRGFTDAVLFGPQGRAEFAASAFYGNPLVVHRGRFRPVSLFDVDIVRSARTKLAGDYGVDADGVMSTFEISLDDVTGLRQYDPSDLLERVDAFSSIGARVLVSNLPEFYRLSSYLRRYTDKPVSLVAGPHQLYEIFNRTYYENLDGGLLEAIGRLFKSGVRVACYPMVADRFADYLEQQHAALHDSVPVPSRPPDEMIRVDTITLPAQRQSLLEHLVMNGIVVSVGTDEQARASVSAFDLARIVGERQNGWQEFLPEPVAAMVEARNLFAQPLGQ